MTVSLDTPRKSLALHYRHRYDPRDLSGSEKSMMTEMIEAWLAENDPKSAAAQNRMDD